MCKLQHLKDIRHFSNRNNLSGENINYHLTQTLVNADRLVHFITQKKMIDCCINFGSHWVFMLPNLILHQPTDVLN